jgi:hypothetical protein
MFTYYLYNMSRPRKTYTLVTIASKKSWFPGDTPKRAIHFLFFSNSPPHSYRKETKKEGEQQTAKPGGTENDEDFILKEGLYASEFSVVCPTRWKRMKAWRKERGNGRSRTHAAL